MKFRYWGKEGNPTIILLHGGGLSWWSFEKIIEDFKDKFYVVAVIIDGHSDDAENTFISIEDSSSKLIRHIDEKCDKKVFALMGLSIGAQIITEIISTRKDITQYAIIESALIFPLKLPKWLIFLSVESSYWLIRKKWFSKLQAKSLLLPKEMLPRYYEDSIKISKQTLVNISLSNGNYSLKKSIEDTASKTLIIVGSKELKIMIKSAEELHKIISNSNLFVAKNMKHGELSLQHPDLYVKIITDFWNNK